MCIRSTFETLDATNSSRPLGRTHATSVGNRSYIQPLNNAGRDSSFRRCWPLLYLRLLRVYLYVVAEIPVLVAPVMPGIPRLSCVLLRCHGVVMPCNRWGPRRSYTCRGAAICLVHTSQQQQHLLKTERKWDAIDPSLLCTAPVSAARPCAEAGLAGRPSLWLFRPYY